MIYAAYTYIHIVHMLSKEALRVVCVCVCFFAEYYGLLFGSLYIYTIGM